MLANNGYWDSTEFAAAAAGFIGIGNGNFSGGLKTDGSYYKVRCVREQ